MSKLNEAKNHFSIEELEHAFKIAARVVALYGETYLPIFNRLHEEVLMAKGKQNQKSLAMQLALSYSEIK
jgi:bacterioferritin (cytochrome b1)